MAFLPAFPFNFFTLGRIPAISLLFFGGVIVVSFGPCGVGVAVACPDGDDNWSGIVGAPPAGVGVGINVGVGVGVTVDVGVAVTVGVEVGVAVDAGVGVAVDVGVGVAIAVGVAVAVGVGVAIGVAVAVIVGVGVGSSLTVKLKNCTV